MRYKDSNLLDRIKTFAEDFYLENKRSPSMAEIAKSMGICRDTANRYVHALREKGAIRYDGKTILTDKILDSSTATRADVYEGSIPCGTPEEVEAAVAGYVYLPTSIFGKSNYYIIKTTGNSMINAGIDSGDLVVVEKTHEAKKGDIVVALHDNENTLKRLGYDKKRKCVKLIPENDHMEPIYVRDIEIQGVAKFIIKAI